MWPKGSMRMCIYMYGLGIDIDGCSLLYASTSEYHITRVLGMYCTLSGPEGGQAGV